jgi:hypothetical protein
MKRKYQSINLNMEIPYMILDEVKRLELKDIKNNQVLLCLTLNNVNYEINVSPSVIQYRGLYFQIDSQNIFETVVQNLLRNILQENKHTLNFEIEYNNYNPIEDPLFETLQVRVKSCDQSHMYWEFPTSDYNIIQKVTKALSFLYFVTPSYHAQKRMVTKQPNHVSL